MGDIVEPSGAEFSLPLPLLWMHHSDQPIGHVIAAKATKTGIAIKAKILTLDEPGTLKDRLDLAWQSIKLKLVRGLSIGFNAIETARIDGTGGLHFLKWNWLELSAVTIPANMSASISTIRSIDTGVLAALGADPSAVARPSAGVSAQVALRTHKGVRPMPKTIQEQIESFNASRQAKDARRNDIMQKSAETGETLDEAQSTEHDDLTSEIDSIDKHLARLDAMQKAQAVRPVVAATPEAAAASRTGTTVVSVKANRPAGIGFARVALAKIMAPRNGTTIKEYISERWPDDTDLKAYFQKAAVPAGTTTTATWAGNWTRRSGVGVLGVLTAPDAHRPDSWPEARPVQRPVYRAVDGRRGELGRPGQGEAGDQLQHDRQHAALHEDRRDRGHHGRAGAVLVAVGRSPRA
jgi:HK97 family phage prohead protease